MQGAVPPAASVRDRVFLGFLLSVALAVGLVGISRYAYIGQDFGTHRSLILSYPSGYSYNLTNPPGLYWLGSVIRGHLAPAHYLEALALALLALNLAALGVLYGFLWRAIAGWQLRYSAAAFVTLVPFRVIHSLVIAADALTLPVFAAVALATQALFARPDRFAPWVGLSLGLLAGVLCKYSVAGLFPPVALLLVVSIARNLPPGRRLRWAAVGALALALPASVFLCEMSESLKVKGPITNAQWLARGAPPVMRWRDIVLPQPSDRGVLSAPDYFGGQLFAFRKFSYPGLLHVSSLTDIFNFYQPPPKAVSALPWSARAQEPFPRSRSAVSQELQAWSSRLGLVFSALALAGTVAFAVRGIRSLLPGGPRIADATLILTALAVGFYLPILLSLPRIGDPYTAGFWLPRLVLPALLVFYGLGFVLVDGLCGSRAPGGRLPGILRGGFAVLAGLECLIFLGFLA